MRPRPWCLLVLGLAAGTAPAAGEDFTRDGLAFVEKHCLHCHGDKKPKGDLDLHRYRDATAVLKDRKVWQAVLDRVRAGEMPPPKRPQPAPGEVEAFVRSVEAVFARANGGRPDPGRVTARRLNRVEYNNTIRDLVGVDFHPAEDFPSDDVGYGFDNIGDVLSVSPLHMERYLAAAESIVARAIVVGPPPRPARRPVEAQFLLPQDRKRFRDKPVRELETKDELYTYYKIHEEGDYRLRIRAAARPAGEEPARLALRLDGREVHTTAVRALPADYQSQPLHLTPGRYRAAITFLNPHAAPKEPQGPKGGEVKRALVVQRLELEGPLDSYPASHKRLMACTPGKPPREQAREILTRFASRAYRRPATAAEVERLLTVVDDAQKHGEKLEAGVGLAVQAVLVSPRFLFRLEPDDRPGEPGPRPIDDYQLASRLSYFLWSSMPDDELFALAGKRALHADLDGQVKRMLKDPRADALVENFAMQWLQLGRLKLASPDTNLFPVFDEKLRGAMARETELFVGAVFREDRSILELLDADFTFLNEPLARHYGIVDTNGNRAGQKNTRPGGRPIRGERFVRVSLGESGRGGLLTQASVLTVTSNPTRTSPVKRGKWVLEQILGTPPPAPPPGVPELPDGPKAALTGSLRQRMEQHRANPSCAVCHTKMDALGFAFENFDAVGAFRSRDGDFQIDPSGTLPGGRSFRGPAELKKILQQKKDLFARCLSEKMLTYALGRGLEPYDRPAVDRIVASLAKEDYRFSTLVREIVRSDPFRLRRGKDPSP
jgi:mono/diheme cytochrome c family protein